MKFSNDQLKKMKRDELYNLAVFFDIKCKKNITKKDLLVLLTDLVGEPLPETVKPVSKKTSASEKEKVETKEETKALPKSTITSAKKTRTKTSKAANKKNKDEKALAEKKVLNELATKALPEKKTADKKPAAAKPAQKVSPKQPKNKKVSETNSAAAREKEAKKALEILTLLAKNEKEAKQGLAAKHSDTSKKTHSESANKPQIIENQDNFEDSFAIKNLHHIMRLDRSFAKIAPNASERQTKGANAVNFVAVPIEVEEPAEKNKMSDKASKIEENRKVKFATLKTTMNIPIFEDSQAQASSRLRAISEEELTGDLPEEYGETKVTMQIRDPHCAWVYWEIPLVERKKLELEVGIFEYMHSVFVLKLYNVTFGETSEIRLDKDATSAFVNLEKAGCVYQAELGLQSPKEGYTFVAMSNLVKAPAVPTIESSSKPPLIPQSDVSVIQRAASKYAVTFEFPNDSDSSVSEHPRDSFSSFDLQKGKQETFGQLKAIPQIKFTAQLTVKATANQQMTIETPAGSFEVKPGESFTFETDVPFNKPETTQLNFSSKGYSIPCKVNSNITLTSSD